MKKWQYGITRCLIVAFLFIVSLAVLSFGNLAHAAEESTEEETDNKFTGMTLSLDGTIGFNFYVDSNHTLSDEAYVDFNLSGGGTQKVAIKNAVETSNGLKFTCMVPAKEMADTVTATLCDGEQDIDKQSVSIRDYAETIIQNVGNSEDYTKAKSLMKTMLHYGTYAQKLFNHNVVDFANKNYTSTDDVQSVTIEELGDFAKGKQGLDEFGVLAGATLVLEGETTLRMFFEFEDSVVSDELKFVVNGVEQSHQTSGSYYIVECKNIAATDLDTEYKVEVMLGEETKFEAYCSAMTFCYNALNNSTTSDTLKNVARALYLYNVSADMYMQGGIINFAEDYDAINGIYVSNANRGFMVQDGKLVSTTNVGEGKAMVKESVNSVKSVSVDIYPGDDNKINTGIYLGASNAQDAQDQINALVVIVQSNFSGWTDAPNRTDLIIGSFPTWQEFGRIVSETGNQNALFTNGVKEPLHLKVDIDGQVLMVTLSLISDSSKYITMQYTYTGDYTLDAGQVGIRAQYDEGSYDNFKIVTAENEVTYTFDEETDRDAFDFYRSSVREGITFTTTNAMALHSTTKFSRGTLSATLSTGSDGEAGVVFGADEDVKNYYLFRLTTDKFAELVKVEDGQETILEKGVLSAGYVNANQYRVDIIKIGNSIYCYLHYTGAQIICYAAHVDENPLSGNRVGLWSKTAGAMFKDLTYSDSKEVRKAEVLIFGHSYTELWYDYKEDFSEYPSIDDIGIGGSIAAHWESLTDEVISYEPELGIYDIGINDLSIGLTPRTVIHSTEKTLLEIKNALPDFEVVLVSVSHCPARSTITKQIAETNALMRNLAASYDWIYYAEAEYLFCTDANNPTSTDDSLFTDGLHPTTEGYQLMAASIKTAINGENQPEYDESLAQSQFEETKARKLASLKIYSEHAYTTENWVEAEEYYDAAISKVSACTTEQELNALDLSEETAALEAISNKSENIVADLLNEETQISYQADAWTSVDEHTISMSGYAYALDKSKIYNDCEVVFSAGNSTNTVSTGGIFLRTSVNKDTGLDGYLINYVSDKNYLQVYYMNNVYNSSGTAYTLTYLGGVVYGTYGDVLETDFYVKIEGDKLYLSTFDAYMAGEDPLTVVDLTYNGEYAVYEKGYFGELAWNSDTTYDLSVTHFCGTGQEPEGKQNWDNDGVLKILNIGNSFSVDSQEYVYQIAQDLGVQNIKLGNLYIGGCSLATHLKNAINNSASYTYYTNSTGTWETTNNYPVRYALESENWDYVVFQQVSALSGVADTYDNLNKLINIVEVHAPQAKYAWQMTWAYQQNSTHADFAKYNSDQMTMYNAIVSAVQSKIVNNTKIDYIIPSGTAIQNARTSYLGDTLTRDGYHLTYDFGRYLAGATVAHTLLGKEVNGLTYKPAGVSEDMVNIAMESVANAIAKPYEVTESKYKEFDYSNYMQLDLSFTSSAFYSSNLHENLIASTTDALCNQFYATKMFTKTELPVGTIIEIAEGYRYRPEGWPYNGTRPGNTSTSKVIVDDAWWGDYTKRAFNISSTSGTSLLNLTDAERAEIFKIYVPKEEYLELTTTFYASSYYNSILTSGYYDLYTDNTNFFATKKFSLAELPVGTILEVASGYQYRPEGWINGAKNASRPGNVSTTRVVVDAAWWGDYTERAFNISAIAGGSLSGLTSAQRAEIFKIYVPKVAYQQETLEFTGSAFYDASLHDVLLTEHQLSPKFFATKKFTKAELPVGTVIEIAAGYQYRPDGWPYNGTDRPGNVTSTRIVVDEAWWRTYTERGFNISTTSLADISSLTDIHRAGIFKIYVPEKTIDAISGKKIAWLGSSVTYGSATGGYSMVDVIAEEHINSVCYKYAVSGTTLVNESENSYVARLQQIDTTLELDMLVVQLSTNDATQGKTLGEISDNVDIDSFDTTTVAGAIEYIIAYAQNTWNCPVVFYTGTYYDSTAYASMVELLLNIQDKWGIGVIDLWNDAEMTALYGTEQYSKYMSDAIHPKALGYKEWWAPKFEEYMLQYWGE